MRRPLPCGEKSITYASPATRRRRRRQGHPRREDGRRVMRFGRIGKRRMRFYSLAIGPYATMETESRAELVRRQLPKQKKMHLSRKELTTTILTMDVSTY